MEKLTLPMPEDHGFGVYDGKVLVFEPKGERFWLTAVELDDFELAYGHRLANVDGICNRRKTVWGADLSYGLGPLRLRFLRPQRHSTKANALGMRPMQERAYERRGEQYLLIKSPPASGKSRALMFIALDKLANQGLKQSDHRCAGKIYRRELP